MVLVVQGFPTKLCALQVRKTFTSVETRTNLLLIVPAARMSTTALRTQFEWAWQNPRLSRHLQVTPLTIDETAAGTKRRGGPHQRGRAPARLGPVLLILARMLQVPLWARLGLRLNFLQPDILERFQRLRPAPPAHMWWLLRSLNELAPTSAMLRMAAHPRGS